MSRFPVFSAFHLPSAIAVPSSDCLQWSEDGQAILTTRSAIYILTPNLGVDIELPSLVKQLSEDNCSFDRSQTLEWWQTSIEWEQDSDLHLWPNECQEWDSVSMGSLDPHFRTVSCSPSKINSDGGVVLAVLNSNLQFSLWIPTKNLIGGKWQKVSTWEHIRRELTHGRNADTEDALSTTLQAQVTSIAWSPQANFSIVPSPALNGSLLAVGSRAGVVSLHRYSSGWDDKNTLSRVQNVTVGDRWVIYLSWSSWRSSQSRQCYAFLACGLADGSIIVARVSQTLKLVQTVINVSDEDCISVVCTLMHKPREASYRRAIIISWVDTSLPRPILVFHTLGELHFWFSPSSPDAVAESFSVVLQTQNLSAGSSSLSGVSGSVYLWQHDVLIVSLADGSFHVVENVGTRPTLRLTSSNNGLTTCALSSMSRSVFSRVETDPQYVDVNRISGMQTFDQSSLFSWVYESCRPTRFDYKHDAKHTSVLVVAQMLPDPHDDYFLDHLRKQIDETTGADGTTPSAVLRSTFLLLGDSGRFRRVHVQLLQILKSSSHSDSASIVPMKAWPGELTPQLRSEFRRSLQAHLFGSRFLQQQRVKITITKFCEKSTDDPLIRSQFAATEVELLNAVHHTALQIIIQHLTTAVALLSENDLPFALRIVIGALLPGSPVELVNEARNFSLKIKAKQNYQVVDHNELCPACHTPIEFNDFVLATCPNNHVWARCSVTSFILSTPNVRTCLGCRRKAFLPVSRSQSGPTWLPPYARTWIVEEFLAATRRCLFCGNNFVTLL